MPLILITGEDGQQVYQGEGELAVYEDSPLGRRVELWQTRRVGDEVRGRSLDLTEFLNAISPDWSVHRRVRPVLALDFGLDPPTVAVDVHEEITELRLSCSAHSLGWLRDVLEQGFETAEERNAWHEARAEALRRAYLPPLEMIREELGFPAPPERPSQGIMQTVQPTVDWEQVGRELREHMAPARENAAQGFASFRETLGHIRTDQPLLRDFIEAENEQRGRVTRALIAEMYDFPEGIVYSADSVRVTLDTALSRSAEHERILEEARAEFPHDPLDYGRIYPGHSGTSRWTPPDDPNEKIRSCP